MVVIKNQKTKTTHLLTILPHEDGYIATCDKPKFEIIGKLRTEVYDKSLKKLDEIMNGTVKEVEDSEPEIEIVTSDDSIRRVIKEDKIYNIMYKDLIGEVEAKTTAKPIIIVRAPTREEAYEKIKKVILNE